MTNQIAPVNLLKSIQTRVNQILPKVVDEKRFLQIITEEFRKNPKLSTCTPDSIVAAIVKCSREGLEPGEECYLLPRWNNKKKTYECCYQRGYPGVLTLARRTGEFSNLSIGIVHEGDDYELLEGTENKLVIRRAMKNRGEPIFYWASCKTISGETDFEVLSVEDAERHRDRFASTRDKKGNIFGNWVDNFDSMALKTVIIKLLKYKPKSYEKINPVAGDGVYGVEGKEIYQVDYEQQSMLPESTADQINDEVADRKTLLDKPEFSVESPEYKKIIDEVDKLETKQQVDLYRADKKVQKVIESFDEKGAAKIYKYIDVVYNALP